MKVLVNSISTLINIRLTEFRSEMISMKNKNGGQSVFFRRSGLWSNGEKSLTGDSHPQWIVSIIKNSTENNNNNGPVFSQKRPITKNDGGSNSQEKDPSCQNPAKTVTEAEVDL